MNGYDLMSHLQPPEKTNGFAMDDRWIWCGSAVKGEDGKYHLFAASWSRERPFFSGYVFSSEIVHAVSDRPEGPFVYAGTVLPDRGEQYWDGRMTHNPTVYCWGGTYYLFYIGATYPGARPDGDELLHGKSDRMDAAYGTIRIGVATAKSVWGPWERRDEPVFSVNPDSKAWDNTVVTNPTACFLPDGTVYLYYRSSGMRLGVAKAHVRDLHFERLAGPILSEHPDWSIEDPYVWYQFDHFEMITKDMTGLIAGQKWGGAHLLSQDGIHWEPADKPMAYTRLIRWADGTEEEAYHLERPCLLFEDGRPVCMYCAYGEGKNEPLPYEHASFARMSRSWNLAFRIG